MNNKLQKEWDELVDDAKAGCTALMQHYDAAIIAADELIKEQQAHIERLREALSNLEQAAKYTSDAHGIDVYADLCETAGEACRVLNETPAQSLEALKREWNCPTIENGTNRYGLDVAYFRNLFNRELNGTWQNYKPSELARNLLRMARTADSSIVEEDEFTVDVKREWQAEALERCVKLYATKVFNGPDMYSDGVLDYALKIREGNNNG